MKMACKHMEDFEAAKILRPPRQQQTEHEKWVLPDSGIVKLNTDAACRRGRGTGLGAVLRDSEGDVFWVRAQRIASALSVDVAEIQAVEAGVDASVQAGVSRIIIKMDSQVAFSALCKPKEDISYFGGIVDNVLKLCKSFESYSFNWVLELLIR